MGNCIVRILNFALILSNPRFSNEFVSDSARELPSIDNTLPAKSAALFPTLRTAPMPSSKFANVAFVTTIVDMQYIKNNMTYLIFNNFIVIVVPL